LAWRRANRPSRAAEHAPALPVTTGSAAVTIHRGIKTSFYFYAHARRHFNPVEYSTKSGEVSNRRFTDAAYEPSVAAACQHSPTLLAVANMAFAVQVVPALCGICCAHRAIPARFMEMRGPVMFDAVVRPRVFHGHVIARDVVRLAREPLPQEFRGRMPRSSANADEALGPVEPLRRLRA
jgi:hypothetical protein